MQQERFAGYSWREALTVSVETLDGMILKHGKPHFIKIDVEGFELEVLRGLSQPIDCISIEFTPELVHNSIKCIDYLETLGPVEFNYGKCNDADFYFPYWVKRPQIDDYLCSVKDYRIEFGDIYVKTCST